MSMPVIVPSHIERCSAITDMIQSVALEQTALSHILNAEGEKIQKMIALDTATPEQLLATNKSVRSMVDSISRLEILLQAKLIENHGFPLLHGAPSGVHHVNAAIFIVGGDHQNRHRENALCDA